MNQKQKTQIYNYKNFQNIIKIAMKKKKIKTNRHNNKKIKNPQKINFNL